MRKLRWKVLGLGIGFGQPCWVECHVVLRGRRRAVAEPGLELKQRHRFFGIEELTGNGRPCAMTADPTARIGGRNTGFATEYRNEPLVQVLAGQCSGAEENKKSTLSAVLESQTLG